MPRTIQLHPISLTLGLALALVVFVSMAQLTPSGPRIEYGPHPRDFVTVQEGTPFIVPPGKVFVPTAVGTPGFGASAGVFLVNGVEEARAFGTAWGGGEDMVPLPHGGSFPAGSIIEAYESSALNAVVWGYLAADHSISGSGMPAIRVRFDAPARDNVVITSGTPYVVPGGRLLVVTALGQSARIFANGVVLCEGVNPDNDASMCPVPEGCVIAGGSTVTITSPGGGTYPGRAWGYLVNQ